MVYIIKYLLQTVHPIAELITDSRITVDLFLRPREEVKYNSALRVC